MSTAKHPLEPLTADEVRLAVSVLRDTGKVTPTTRFVSVSLKEPPKASVHGFGNPAANAPRLAPRELDAARRRLKRKWGPDIRVARRLLISFGWRLSGTPRRLPDSGESGDGASG